MKRASMSSLVEGEEFYDCHYEWPDDCSVQGGNSGVVFSPNGNYQTAFFEAFPKTPSTFIRGEAETIEGAEKNAWEKYQRIVNCKEHEYEKRGYKNGLGFCVHCDLQKSNAFEPEQYCKICNAPTNWKRSNKDDWYCKEHSDMIPEDDKFSWQKDERKSDALLAMLFAGTQ